MEHESAHALDRDPVASMDPVESRAEMLARHKKEAREHESAARKLLKQANKNKAKIALAEAEALRLRYDMEARHREELKSTWGEEGVSDDEEGEAEEEERRQEAGKAKELEDRRIEAKKAKA